MVISLAWWEWGGMITKNMIWSRIGGCEHVCRHDSYKMGITLCCYCICVYGSKIYFIFKLYIIIFYIQMINILYSSNIHFIFKWYIPLFGQSVCQSVRKPDNYIVGESVSQSASKSARQPAGPPASQSITTSACRSTSQSISP